MSITATTLEGAIVQWLIQWPNISDIVGTRIYPESGAEKFPRPKLTIFRVDTVRTFSNDGPLGKPRARIQLTASTDDYLTARQLLDACRQAMDGYTGDMCGVQIQGIHALDERDITGYQPQPGKEKPIIRLTQDYYCDFLEV